MSFRRLTSPEGGFYSAEDADSEGVEGKFYVWSKKEVEETLRDKDAQAFCRQYDITDVGNFEGKNMPNLRLCFKKIVSREQYRFKGPSFYCFHCSGRS